MICVILNGVIKEEQAVQEKQEREEQNNREEASAMNWSPERALVEGRISENAAAPVIVAMTNMFYIIFVFAGWYFSTSFLVGSSIFVGMLMITLILFQVCIAGYDENHIFTQSLLVYFPVNAKRLRRELYRLMWKYIGIQAGITCVPMLINMMVDFQPKRFFSTLIALVLSMCATGTLIILGSMSRINAER